jgi:hypothetical protein
MKMVASTTFYKYNPGWRQNRQTAALAGLTLAQSNSRAQKRRRQELEADHTINQASSVRWSSLEANEGSRERIGVVPPEIQMEETTEELLVRSTLSWLFIPNFFRQDMNFIHEFEPLNTEASFEEPEPLSPRPNDLDNEAQNTEDLGLDGTGTLGDNHGLEDLLPSELEEALAMANIRMDDLLLA